MRIDFSFGKCKSKAVYSARLRKQGSLNLENIKKKFPTVLETPILIVIKVKDIEVIVHKHGELLFKNCKDVWLMEKIAGEIYEEGLVKTPQTGKPKPRSYCSDETYSNR